MSLPRYVINMEEGLPYLIPNDPTEDPNIVLEVGDQRAKGFRIDTKENDELEWVTEFPFYITSIYIEIDREYEDVAGLFSLKIDEDEIFSDILVVNNDFTDFRSFSFVPKGSKITMSYLPLGRGGESVYVDIDFLGDPYEKKVRFSYWSRENVEIAPMEVHSFPKGEFTLKAKNIDNYVPLRFRETFTVDPSDEEIQEIEFIYRKEVD